MRGVPHRLMKGRCAFCGRTLRYAKIPNRGPVMAHAKGEAEICRRLIATGNDIPSRMARDAARKAEAAERLAAIREARR